MSRTPLVDRDLLEAALVGLQHKKSEIDQQIATIRKRLRVGRASAPAGIKGLAAYSVLDINKVGRPRRLVDENAIRELRQQGLSFRQIARRTGFGYGTVRRTYFAVQRHRDA